MLYNIQLLKAEKQHGADKHGYPIHPFGSPDPKDVDEGSGKEKLEISNVKHHYYHLNKQGHVDATHAYYPVKHNIGKAH